MQRWGHAVESVVADDSVFPVHRIVERVGARVASVPVEIVLGERGAHASRRDNTDRSLARSAWESVPRKNRPVGYGMIGHN